MRYLVLLVVLCELSFAQTSSLFVKGGHEGLFLPSIPHPTVFVGGSPVEIPGAKNPGLAALYSLLIPGLGELYVGEYGSGKYFSIAEAVLWLGFGSLNAYGDWLRDDARQFAVFHAGIDPGGKDDQYFVEIGNYRTIDDYNNQKLLERSIARLYDPARGFSWQWDSDANRASYRELRISHDRIFNSTRFVAAAVIVNHIASAVNAARLAIAHNNVLEQALQIDFHARVTNHAYLADGIMISVSATF